MHGLSNPIKQSPVIGYTHHRIILDSHSKPCDYEFIDYNEVFLKIIGLEHKNLLGKKASSIFPSLLEEQKEWISTAWAVALNGEEKTIEQYSENLDKWYKVHLFSTDYSYFTSIYVDTSKSRSFQKEIQNNSERYDELTEQNRIIAWEVDKTGLYTYVSPAIESITGYKPFEVIGKFYFYDLHPKEGRDEFKEAAFAQFAVKQSFKDLLNPIQTRDGKIRWVSTNGIPILDENGNLLGYKGTDTEVTEQKIIDDTRNKERDLFNNGPVCVFEWEPVENWPIISVTDNCEQVLGYSKEELMNDSFRYADLIHPDDLKHIAIEVEFNLTNGINRFEQTYRLKTKWGAYRSFVDYTIVDRTNSGEIVTIRGYIFDVSNQKQLELELKQEQIRLEGIIEGAHVGTWEWNVQTGELKINKLWASILGYSMEELEPVSIQTWIKLVQPDDRIRSNELLEKHFAGETDYYELETRLKHKNGHWVWILDRGKVAQWTKDGHPLLMLGTHLDITERKNHEQELILSEEKFRTYVNSSPIGIFEIGKNGALLESNPTGCEITGYSYSELMKCTVFDLLENESNEQTTNFLKGTFSGNQQESVFKVIHKKGYMCWVSILATKINDNKVIAFCKDVTQRIESEIVTKEAILRKDLAAKASGVGIWDYNVETNELIWDDFMFELYGINKQDFTGKFEDWLNLMHPDDRNAQLWEVELSTFVQDDFNSEFRIYHPDGSIRYINSMGLIIRDENRKPIRLVGTNWDNTYRKLAELELQTRENELRESLKQVEIFKMLVETSGDCFYLCDLDNNGKMLYVNEASEKHFGAPREEIYTWTISDWDKDFTEESLPDLIQRVINAKRMQLSTHHLKGDGTIVPVETTVNYLINKEGKRLAYGWFADISKRLKAEKELRDAKQQAEAANKAKSEFLANMSHEIRTPLNGIIGFTDLLKNTALTPLQKQYIDNVNVSGHALLGVINDVLDFSKIEAGMLRIENIKTDLIELFEHSIDLVKFPASQKNIELLLNLDSSMPRFAWVDPTRLKQILINILGNAVKFTDFGEVELRVDYKSIQETKGELIITVRDTGIGISELEQKKLFKAFSQADSSTTRKYGGTGLGLTISDRLAQHMGSKIGVTSSLGNGSVFQFKLIAEMVLDKTVTKEIIELDKIKRCLVIDDNINSQLILQNMLNQWGIESVLCEKFSDVIKIIDSNTPFDFVLCDYNIPNTNGLEIIKYVKNKFKQAGNEIPAILMYTSADDTELHHGCEALEIKHRLNKPVKKTDLLFYLQHINQDESKVAEINTSFHEELFEEKKVDDFRTILVVEDVVINKMMVKSMLNHLFTSSKIVEASSGREAIEKYIEFRPDFILMDVQMPELDGIEATKHIRDLEKSTQRHVPIIALTAGAFKEERERCIAAGMDDFLAKPIELKKLREVILRVVSIESTEQITSNRDHFNESKLINRLDEKMANAVLTQFIHDLPEYIIELNTAFKQSNIDEIRKKAHKIKGACLNTEIPLLAQYAAEIEKKARENASKEELLSLLDLVQKEADWVILHLKNIKS